MVKTSFVKTAAKDGTIVEWNQETSHIYLTKGKSVLCFGLDSFALCHSMVNMADKLNGELLKTVLDALTD